MRANETGGIVTDPLSVQELTVSVQAAPKYATISPGLVERIIQREMLVTKNEKELIHRTRSKLHQVASAYQEKKIPYEKWYARLDKLPTDLQDAEVQAFCLESMKWHASTRERIPFLADFYQAIFQKLGKVTSILDLACGLNPLALPWMPQARAIHYFGCDIFTDQADFLNAFLHHFGITGQIDIVDLTAEIPTRITDVVFLLKTLPCLEQVEKSIGRRLLDDIKSNKVVVSFPSASLGGRKKGMAQNYETHFMELISRRDWKAEKLSFDSELVFILSR